jgi:hypothetical protein
MAACPFRSDGPESPGTCESTPSREGCRRNLAAHRRYPWCLANVAPEGMYRSRHLAR